jgi:hypothetical protein
MDIWGFKNIGGNPKEKESETKWEFKDEHLEGVYSRLGKKD